MFPFICFVISFWDKLSISFWTFDKLLDYFLYSHITLFFISSLKYSFSSGRKCFIFSKRSLLFLGRCVHFFIKPVLTFLKSTRSSKKINWSRREEREESRRENQNTQKKWLNLIFVHIFGLIFYKLVKNETTKYLQR